MAKIEILAPGVLPEKSVATLRERFTCHRAHGSDEVGAIVTSSGDRIRGIARGGHFNIDRALLDRLPKLEIIANFGVGYDGIDLKGCAERGILVTNTPDVLTEEVADTALGLLLMTVRELSAAERHLRAGNWSREGNYRLTPATLRDRTVGIAGLGRIGLAIARRLDAMKVPVVYHARHERRGLPYRYYADLRAMAEAVDTLVVVLPGTPQTKGIVNADLLRALGSDGILINIGRGSVVDEEALIEALRAGVIRAAGLDVFVEEPHVPEALLALDNVVLLPHVGSASVFTRDAMGQLVVDNLTSWFEAGKPLTPVPETPWPPRGG
jgi:lactate dehydrogenase-like 2-hydroxyacid dehydrogenase